VVSLLLLFHCDDVSLAESSLLLCASGAAFASAI